MPLPARFLFVFIGFFAIFLSLSIPVLAEQPSGQSVVQLTSSTDANVPQNINTLFQGALWGMLSFASCMVSGIDITSASQKCLGQNPQTGKLGYVPNQRGLLGIASSAIATLYSPPKFHVGTYIGYLRNDFGVVKPSYAAGTSGFDQLTPIMKLWIAFRNVTYLLFVIVFVVIGFAIMLRAKIDPRTVMTIENQIPKIIVALILVSFSYAIAGLVVDIMWLMTFVTINLFGSLDPSIQVTTISQNVSSNPLAFLNNIAPGGIIGLIMQPASSVYDILVPLVKNVVDSLGILAFPGIIPCYLQAVGSFISNPISAIGNGIGNLVTGNAGNALGTCIHDGFIQMVSSIAGVVAFLIFGFALAFAVFRLWFSLLKSYALFLIYAILGPFFIMMGVLPGTKINFDNWIRHLLAYSLVFPFAMGTMLLGKVLTDVYTTSSIGYIPPLVGVTQNTVSPIGPLIGFAVILLIPQSLTMLQDALAAPDIKYLPGIGQMLAAGTQAYSTVVSQPWKRITRPYDQMRGLSEGGLRKLVMNIPLPFGKKIRDIAGEKEPPSR